MKRLIPCLLLAATLPLAAQFSLNTKYRGDKPILINSDAMDVDIENGKATFYGNVIVNDPEVIITCDRMVLYQEPKQAKKPAQAAAPAGQPAPAAKPASGKSSDDLMGGDTRLERIECIGNVVITRKNTGEKSQWGKCGKAIYYHKLGKITMLLAPYLYQDDSMITGTRLSFFRDSKRIEGTDIKISARNLGEEENDPKNPARKKRTPAPASDAGSFEDYYRGEGKSGNSGAKPAGTPQAHAGKKMSRQEADAILGLDEVPADAK